MSKSAYASGATPLSEQSGRLRGAIHVSTPAALRPTKGSSSKSLADTVARSGHANKAGPDETSGVSQAAEDRDMKQGSRGSNPGSGKEESSTSTDPIIVIIIVLSIGGIIVIFVVWCWLSTVVLWVSWCVCTLRRLRRRGESPGVKKSSADHQIVVPATFCDTLASVVCLAEGPVTGDGHLAASASCTPDFGNVAAAGSGGSDTAGSAAIREGRRSTVFRPFLTATAFPADGTGDISGFEMDVASEGMRGVGVELGVGEEKTSEVENHAAAAARRSLFSFVSFSSGGRNGDAGSARGRDGASTERGTRVFARAQRSTLRVWRECSDADASGVSLSSASAASAASGYVESPAGGVQEVLRREVAWSHRRRRRRDGSRCASHDAAVGGAGAVTGAARLASIRHDQSGDIDATGVATNGLDRRECSSASGDVVDDATLKAANDSVDGASPPVPGRVNNDMKDEDAHITETSLPSPALPRARALWRAFSEVDHDRVKENHRQATQRYIDRVVVPPI